MNQCGAWRYSTGICIDLEYPLALFQIQARVNAWPKVRYLRLPARFTLRCCRTSRERSPKFLSTNLKIHKCVYLCVVSIPNFSLCPARSRMSIVMEGTYVRGRSTTQSLARPRGTNSFRLPSHGYESQESITYR
jgi:hypothetical protein